MLGQALRGINLKWITKILFVGVAFFAIFFLAFPTEALADDSDLLNCGISDVTGCPQVWSTYIVNALVGFVAWVLYFAATIFEATLNFSIHTDYNDLTAVKSGWILFRDLINILFIFILLYIAFGTVLKIEKVNWKKQLASIIIAAILVNFSLFITRVAIDASNIVALGIHTQLTTCDNSSGNCTGTRNGEATITITEAITNSLGLPETFAETAFSNEARSPDGLRNGLIRLGVITLVIWAFISVAVLFVVRTIVFVFLLVTSPIGVAGASLPMLQEPAKEWRKNLFDQALVAPVFLLMMYVILRMASDLMRIDESGHGVGAGGELLVGGSLAGAGGSLDASFWLNFILLLAFIIAAVKITKKFSGKAGEMINKAAGAAVGLGLGLATGGAALAGRAVVGRSAAALNSGGVGERLKKSAEGGNRFARLGQNLLRSGAGSSFDVRQTKLGSLGLKAAPKSMRGGLSVGAQAGKGGRVGAIERAAERDVDRLKDMSSEGLRKWAEMKEERGKSRLGILSRDKNLESAKKLRRLANTKETSKEEREKRVEKAAEDIQKNRGNSEKIKKSISNLKARELAQLPANVFEDEALISQLQIGDLRALQGNLDRDTMEKVVKSDQLNDSVKAWVDDPKNGFPESGRDPKESTSDTFADMKKEDYVAMQKEIATETAAEQAAVIGAVLKETFGDQGGGPRGAGGDNSVRGHSGQPLVDHTGRPLDRSESSNFGAQNQNARTSAPERTFVVDSSGETNVVYPNETTPEPNRRTQEERRRAPAQANHPDWNKTEDQLREDIRRAEEKNDEEGVLRAEHILMEKQKGRA